MNRRTVTLGMTLALILAFSSAWVSANQNQASAAQATAAATGLATGAATRGATSAATGVATRSATGAATSAPTAAAQPFTLFNLNTATSEQFLTIPAMNARMVREFFEYRPYISIVQFRREIGKYVSAAQVTAYEKYVYVPIKVDASDAETLRQIPGLDAKAATELIAARPYGTTDAFLKALAKYLTAEQIALGKNYLDSAVK